MNPSLKNLYEFYTPFQFREVVYNLTKLKYYQATIDQQNQDVFLKALNQYQCIFVHIPKTGGMSIRDSLFSRSSFPPHLSLRNYQTLFGKEKFKAYYKFAFIRNPWDRVVSAFFYLKTNKTVLRNQKWQRHLSKYHSFDEFVKDWVNPRNIQKHVVLIPQYQFILDQQGNMGVDYLAYFENFLEEFNVIQAKLGTNYQLKHINQSNRSNYQDYYTKESKAIIANVYAEDIRNFGYSFN